ncbi:MAG: AsmA family protein [Acidobacteriia bacterium]|nr:AsmA family protein [Terriglobia bacterium]
MKHRIRLALKWLGAGCGLIIVAGIVAPYWSADAYAGRIRLGLEAALGRRVELGEVRFNLFTGPGFSISKVVIHEDPAFGREPFAYVESLEAHPRLWALLGGRLEFASLRLDDTSVNLTRVDSGAGTVWNFAELLHRAKFDALPALYVRSGRVNFKFGDTKSVFYLTDTDLDASPPTTASGAWRLQFSGQPARTDRPAHGFGNFMAEGLWRPGETLDLNFRLDQSAINDVTSLIYGYDIGVHGMLSARARVAGPLANLHINGTLNIEDVHRWDLLPHGGTGWPFEFEGRLNLPAEKLEIDTHSAAKEAPPLAVRFRAADYLSRPHWGVAFNWNRFRVEPLLQLARHLGAQLPEGLKVEGTLDGAIGYSQPGRWQGQLGFQDAAVTIPDSPPVRFEEAVLLFDGSRLRLPPAVARTPENDLARIEGEYELDSGALSLTIATDSMAVAGLRSQAALAAVPVLEEVETGTWNGTLQYRHVPGLESEWSGAFQLENADVMLPGFAEPLRIGSARAKLDGAKVAIERIQASLGDLAALADYRYEPGASRPHRVRVSLPGLDVAELERLMAPALRRNRGLIARALSFGRAPVPDWLRNQGVDGSVAVEALQLAGVELHKMKARLIWNGTTLVLADLTAGLNNGAISGMLSVDLRGAEPVYHLSSRLKGVEWNGGTFDAEASLDASGTGPALLSNLRSEGSFTGQSFDSEPLDQFTSVSGCYKLDWAKPVPHLRFTELQMATDGELFLGRGAMQDDGRLLIQVSNGTRQLSVTGTLARLQLDEAVSQ